MADLLGGASSYTSADVAIQLAQAQLQIQVKQLALANAQAAEEDAQTAVDDANTALTNAQQDLDFAQEDAANAQTAVDNANKAVTEAQKNLDDAKAASPEIIAPFDGFVTKVNVAGGDQVLSGAVAITIADSDKFEANILVSEIDISQVSVGGDATVALDALTGVSLSAKVTQISPTATISSGVVNYAVTVTLQSVTSTNITLKEGLTSTVSLIVRQSKDVLMVPYAAITTENGQSYVQVITATGTTEKRAIKTGVTNYTYTEVTDGLAAGEKISLAKTTTSTTTKTTTTQQPQGGINIPGISGGGGPPGGQ